jgi:hypothetical protein
MEALVLRSIHRLLGVVLAVVVSGLAVVPAANATMFEQFRFVDDPYAFEETICGIDVQGEGTAAGAGRNRTGKGKLASAFFAHVNFAYSETWTADNGQFVTVTGKSNNNEVKEAGQPFRLYDSEGNLLLRDRGVIRSTFDFDTLGDDEPGAELVQDVELSVRGPHPGFEDETLCPVLVPLLTGP